jgi:hypothetical protein
MLKRFVEFFDNENKLVIDNLGRPRLGIPGQPKDLGPFFAWGVM